MQTQITTVPAAWRSYQLGFQDWLEEVNKAPMTRSTYGVAVEQLGAFLASKGMPTDPTVVSREHLGEWLRHMQRPVEDGGQGLTAQTTLQRYRSISRFFAWMVQEDEIQSSPMAKMSPPKVPEKLVPVVDDVDLHKLFKAVDGADFEARRDKAILSLFIDVGLRIAEMTALKLADVDIEARFVTVMGKGRRPREVRFTTTTRADINRYLRKRATHPHADSPKLWIGRVGDMTGSGILSHGGASRGRGGNRSYPPAPIAPHLRAFVSPQRRERGQPHAGNRLEVAKHGGPLRGFCGGSEGRRRARHLLPEARTVSEPAARLSVDNRWVLCGRPDCGLRLTNAIWADDLFGRVIRGATLETSQQRLAVLRQMYPNGHRPHSLRMELDTTWRLVDGMWRMGRHARQRVESRRRPLNRSRHLALGEQLFGGTDLMPPVRIECPRCRLAQFVMPALARPELIEGRWRMVLLPVR